MANFFEGLGRANIMQPISQAIGAVSQIEALKSQKQQQALQDIQLKAANLKLQQAQEQAQEDNRIIPLDEIKGKFGGKSGEFAAQVLQKNGSVVNINGVAGVKKKDIAGLKDLLAADSALRSSFTKARYEDIGGQISAIDQKINELQEKGDPKSQQRAAALLQMRKSKAKEQSAILTEDYDLQQKIALANAQKSAVAKMSPELQKLNDFYGPQNVARMTPQQRIEALRRMDKPAAESTANISQASRTEDGLDAWFDKKDQQYKFRDNDGVVKPLAGSGKKLVQPITPASTILKSKGIYPPEELASMAQDISEGRLKIDRAMKLMGSREVRGINMRGLYQELRKINPYMDIEKIDRLLDAGKKNLAMLVQLNGQIKAYEGNITKQLDQLEEVLPSIGDSGWKKINEWWRSGKLSLSGDPQLRKAQLLIKEVSAEVARIMSSARGTGQNTAAEVMKGWEEVLSIGLTNPEWQSVIPLLRTNLKNRVAAIETEINRATENPVSGNPVSSSGWQTGPGGVRFRVKK